MKLIPLKGKNGVGKFAQVDDGDFDELNRYSWHYHNGYAKRSAKTPGGNQITVTMHGFINKTPTGLHTDHIDGNRLNNTRANLRSCTVAENQYNCGKNKCNKTGYKGVTWNKKDKRFKTQICYGGKRYYLGEFLTAEEAFAAYQAASKFYHGEFAKW